MPALEREIENEVRSLAVEYERLRRSCDDIGASSPAYWSVVARDALTQLARGQRLLLRLHTTMLDLARGSDDRYRRYQQAATQTYQLLKQLRTLRVAIVSRLDRDAPFEDVASA